MPRKSEHPIRICELNRQSFIPLYYQIKAWLMDSMARGELLQGDPIPSEDTIARESGVSRMTVRQAVNDLRIEGYVIRAKGRGTFVAPGAGQRSLRAVQRQPGEYAKEDLALQARRT
jgi:GntR family transcriptional regulator